MMLKILPFKPFLNPDSKPTIPSLKPTVSASVKQRMKLQDDAASGAVTLDEKGVENEDQHKDS